MTNRERLEQSCRMYLRLAAKWSDSGEKRTYDAYSFARARLQGMATALLDIHEFELLPMVRNYEMAADTKALQALGINR